MHGGCFDWNLALVTQLEAIIDCCNLMIVGILFSSGSLYIFPWLGIHLWGQLLHVGGVAFILAGEFLFLAGPTKNFLTPFMQKSLLLAFLFFSILFCKSTADSMPNSSKIGAGNGTEVFSQQPPVGFYSTKTMIRKIGSMRKNSHLNLFQLPPQAFTLFSPYLSRNDRQQNPTICWTSEIPFESGDSGDLLGSTENFRIRVSKS